MPRSLDEREEAAREKTRELLASMVELACQSLSETEIRATVHATLMTARLNGDNGAQR